MFPSVGVFGVFMAVRVARINSSGWIRNSEEMYNIIENEKLLPRYRIKILFRIHPQYCSARSSRSNFQVCICNMRELAHEPSTVAVLFLLTNK